jgi:hypothetical protein
MILVHDDDLVTIDELWRDGSGDAVSGYLIDVYCHFYDGSHQKALNQM